MEAVLTKQELQRARLRAVRRAKIQARNEPPRLTLGAEVFNAVSHGLGALGAAAALTLLLLRSQGAMELLASCVYGISMVAMMLMSCVYHAMPAGSQVKRVCRRFDYTSIYLLIGGTFAPILLVYLGGAAGVAIFCVQWAVILTGVTLVMVFGPGRWRALHFTLLRRLEGRPAKLSGQIPGAAGGDHGGGQQRKQDGQGEHPGLYAEPDALARACLVHVLPSSIVINRYKMVS